MYYVIVLYALVVPKEVDHSYVDCGEWNSIQTNFVVKNTKEHWKDYCEVADMSKLFRQHMKVGIAEWVDEENPFV